MALRPYACRKKLGRLYLTSSNERRNLTHRAAMVPSKKFYLQFSDLRTRALSKRGSRRTKFLGHWREDMTGTLDVEVRRR